MHIFLVKNCKSEHFDFKKLPAALRGARLAFGSSRHPQWRVEAVELCSNTYLEKVLDTSVRTPQVVLAQLF